MKNVKPDIRPYTKQFYKGNIVYFVFALSETLFGAVNALLVSWLIQQLVDLIGGYDTGFTLLQLTIITLGLIGGVAVAHLISYHFKPKFITRGISQYKEYVFGELTKKNIFAFSGENSSTYVSALTNDIQTIEQGYLWNMFSMLASLLTFIGAMVMMIWYSPLLTLMAICLSLLPLIASILTGNKVAQEEKKVSDRNEAYTSTLRDSLGGFSVIKSFKAEAQMIRIFKEKVRELAKAQCGKHKKRILVQMFGFVAGITAQLGVFIFGAYLAMSGKGITAGTTMIFVQLMNYVLSPISTIPTCIAERKAAKALVEKIAGALNANIREEAKNEKCKLERSIAVKDLSFGYEPEKQVLKNVNYTFELGKKYAIVGASGSGKSTMLNLLMASHHNYDGAIYYDDTELREISSDNLYEIESIIQQNVFVFNATIKDNITMFRDFAEEQINEAIRLSGLSALIGEKGTDYLCGENGSGLSGGEKQRISIARSLLKKSQVLLVDEATAALDAETAYQVSSAILGLKGVTGIVVTHSLDEGLLKQYDGIITLKNGSIVESGTFDELIAEKGYFYSLFTISQ
ncbi:MAG: ABC transporter ATP-binding protein [Eubacteriales bacterium]